MEYTATQEEVGRENDVTEDTTPGMGKNGENSTPTEIGGYPGENISETAAPEIINRGGDNLSERTAAHSRENDRENCVPATRDSVFEGTELDDALLGEHCGENYAPEEITAPPREDYGENSSVGEGSNEHTESSSIGVTRENLEGEYGVEETPEYLSGDNEVSISNSWRPLGNSILDEQEALADVNRENIVEELSEPDREDLSPIATGENISQSEPESENSESIDDEDATSAVAESNSDTESSDSGESDHEVTDSIIQEAESFRAPRGPYNLRSKIKMPDRLKKVTAWFTRSSKDKIPKKIE